eukprot:scaffold22356_cov53-Attheya_sp.AAC.7
MGLACERETTFSRDKVQNLHDISKISPVTYQFQDRSIRISICKKAKLHATILKVKRDGTWWYELPGIYARLPHVPGRRGAW